MDAYVVEQTAFDAGLALNCSHLDSFHMRFRLSCGQCVGKASGARQNLKIVFEHKLLY